MSNTNPAAQRPHRANLRAEQEQQRDREDRAVADLAAKEKDAAVKKTAAAAAKKKAAEQKLKEKELLKILLINFLMQYGEMVLI